MPSLSQSQKSAIQLIVRTRDAGDGWRQCTQNTYSMIANSLPSDLLERDDEKKMVRLTSEGLVVAKWI